MRPTKSKQLIFVVFSLLLIYGCAEVLEKDLSKKVVRLTVPAEGVTIADSSVISFAWDSLDGASRYRLQVVSPSFDSAAFLLADTTLTQVFFTVPQINTRGHYQWRVMGLNNTSMTPFSAPRDLTIQ